MKYSRVMLLALVLSACADPQAPPPPTVLSLKLARLPPRRVQDCVTYALLDDKCTATWYSCRGASAEDKTCFRAWEECCALPGQGARSRLGAPETVTED